MRVHSNDDKGLKLDYQTSKVMGIAPFLNRDRSPILLQCSYPTNESTREKLGIYICIEGKHSPLLSNSSSLVLMKYVE